jgi:DNA-binding PadR family transcriptional regulator
MDPVCKIYQIHACHRETLTETLSHTRARTQNIVAVQILSLESQTSSEFQRLTLRRKPTESLQKHMRSFERFFSSSGTSEESSAVIRP